MSAKSKESLFDQKVAVECAKAFSCSTGLGCTVSDTNGTVLYEAGG